MAGRRSKTSGGAQVRAGGGEGGESSDEITFVEGSPAIVN
jgi:hypothetical protein